jgi:hypothetical protein
MNLRKLLKRSRYELGHCSVAIFGARADGKYMWGTGILLDFRGTPLVVTCAHVLDPIVDGPYVTSGRYSHQLDPIHSARFSDPKLDAACLVLRDPYRFAEKKFILASDALLRGVGTDEPIFVHGFPVGNAALQRGGIINPAAATARFQSMTYFTYSAVAMQNTRLGRKQPRVEWNYGANQDAKRFRLLPKDLTPEERGGFSGGPVVVGGITAPWRLAGQMTDASLMSMFYNPIENVLSWLDKTL